MITRKWQRFLITRSSLSSCPSATPSSSFFIVTRIDKGGLLRKRCTELYVRKSGKHRAEECSARASVRVAVQSREKSSR